MNIAQIILTSNVKNHRKHFGFFFFAGRMSERTPTPTTSSQLTQNTPVLNETRQHSSPTEQKRLNKRNRLIFSRLFRHLRSFVMINWVHIAPTDLDPNREHQKISHNIDFQIRKMLCCHWRFVDKNIDIQITQCRHKQIVVAFGQCPWFSFSKKEFLLSCISEWIVCHEKIKADLDVDERHWLQKKVRIDLEIDMTDRIFSFGERGRQFAQTSIRMFIVKSWKIDPWNLKNTPIKTRLDVAERCKSLAWSPWNVTTHGRMQMRDNFNFLCHVLLLRREKVRNTKWNPGVIGIFHDTILDHGERRSGERESREEEGEGGQELDPPPSPPSQTV